MGKRGPLAATDKRRQAGHKRPRHSGADEGKGNGAAPGVSIFNDRRKKMGEGKRAS